MELNEQQNRALKMAIDGHNLVIVGQPGTGKTALLKKITMELESKGKKVQITCTTGIACSNFAGKAKTVHHWAGLQDGRYTASEIGHLIEHSPEFDSVQKRIKNTDVLIVDEISMLSKNMFNQLESVCSIKERKKTFGGLQVIVSGDFFQLPPVANELYHDAGEMCFKSEVFNNTMKHKIVLKTVIRQADAEFICAIKNVSQGTVDEATSKYVKELNRPIDGHTTKLFANNYLVDLYNRKELLKSHGEIKVFKSKDEIQGAKSHLLTKLNVQSTIWLKEGCPVILLRNLTSILVNGLQGKVVAFEESSPIVHFPAVKLTTKIDSVSFTVYSPDENRIVATRYQIPLKLAYALTIHKSQGMTLDRVEVDCQQIFKPGQLGVAMGRVRSADCLRVVNFHPKICLQHPDDVQVFQQEGALELDENLNCCRNHTRSEDDRQGLLIVGTEEDLIDFKDESLEVETETDACTDQVFDEEFNNLVSEIEFIERATQIDLPVDFNIAEVLTNLIFKNPSHPLQVESNDLINEMIMGDQTQVTQFCQKVFLSHQNIIKCITLQEPGPVKPDSISDFFKKSKEIETSESYKTACHALFSHKLKLKKVHSHVCFKIMTTIRKYLIDKIAAGYPTAAHEVTKRTTTEASKGRIRYVGGFCIHKIRKKYLKLQEARMYSLNSVKQLEFDEASDKVNILNSLREEENYLKQTTEQAETLLDTTRKQNLNKGLVHIPDELFTFFELLCEECLSLLNNENLQHHREELHKFVLDNLLKSQNLSSQFENVVIGRQRVNSMFRDGGEDIPLTHITEVFEEITKLFLKVMFNQFRKDLLQSYSVAKTMAHRKQVQVRKQKKESYSVKTVTFETIQKDESQGKDMSHSLLRGLVQSKVDVFVQMKKPELQKLLSAYDIRIKRGLKKSDYVQLLQEAILNTDSMKFPEVLNEREEPSFVDIGDNLVTITNETKEPVPGPSRSEDVLTTTRSDHGSSDNDDEENEDDGLCVVCKKQGKEGVEWIQCSECLQWIHRNCAGLRAKKKWDQYSQVDAKFYCNACAL